MVNLSAHVKDTFNLSTSDDVRDIKKAMPAEIPGSAGYFHKWLQRCKALVEYFGALPDFFCTLSTHEPSKPLNPLIKIEDRMPFLIKESKADDHSVPLGLFMRLFADHLLSRK